MSKDVLHHSLLPTSNEFACAKQTKQGLDFLILSWIFFKTILSQPPWSQLSNQRIKECSRRQRSHRQLAKDCRQGKAHLCRSCKRLTPTQRKKEDN
jgi:hypothetical protein